MLTMRLEQHSMFQAKEVRANELQTVENTSSRMERGRELVRVGCVRSSQCTVPTPVESTAQIVQKMLHRGTPYMKLLELEIEFEFLLHPDPN
jgi:hypothetical protein